MRWYWLLVALMGVVALPVARAEQPSPKLMASVAQVSHVLTDGYGTLDAKGVTVTYATLPGFRGDRRRAAVVLFTMEGFNLSNIYRQFLAVFFENDGINPPPRQPTLRWRLAALTAVGGWCDRVFTSAEVKGTSIHLTGKKWIAGDPMSDPTGVALADYAYQPYYSLVETSKTDNNHWSCAGPTR